MNCRILLSLVCFALLLVIASPVQIINPNPLDFKPGEIPIPGRILPDVTWDQSLHDLTHGHVRNMSNLVHYQPGSRMLTDFFQNNPVPLNSRRCNYKFTYDEKLVYDVDDFLCPKDVALPPNFPRTDDERSPFADLFDTTFQDVMNRDNMEQIEAAQYYIQLYELMDKEPYNTGNFKKCSQRNGYVNPMLETDGYQVIPACYTKPVSYNNQAIAYRVHGAIHPCYIPQPVSLEGVQCFDSKREKSNKCTMGYIPYHEYRCLPSNFITRKIPLVCPGYGMVAISVRVPIACSCKMCYNCGKNFNYNAYSQRPQYVPF